MSPGTRRTASGAAVGLLAGALVLAAHLLGGLSRVEAIALDWRQRLHADPGEEGSVAIVYVDEATLAKVQARRMSWPWQRAVWASVLEELEAAGAGPVVFDIIFSEPSVYSYARDFDDDATFAAAIREHGDVYFVELFSRDPLGAPARVRELAPPVELEDPALAALFPEARGIKSPTLEPFLAGARGIGNVQHAPDPDGVYRRIHPFVRFEGRLYPQIAVAVAAAGRPIRLARDRALVVGDRRVRLEADGTLLLRYSGAVLRAHEGALEALDVAEGTAAARAKGKVVYVGYAAAGLYDLKPNPLLGRSPAVLVHVAATENLLSGRALRTWSSPLVFLGLGALVGGGVAASRRVWQQALFTAAAGGAWLALAVWVAFPRDLVLDLVGPEIAVVAAFAGGTLVNYVAEGRQRRQIKEAFQHYLAPPVIEALLRDPSRLRLGGERRELTIFFSDLAGFTTLSEKLDPEALVRLINQYLTRMTKIVIEHGGTHDKYIGDALMCFFNAPLDIPDHAVRACLVAIEQQREIARLSLPGVHARMGINTGTVVVGNMGSEQIMDYTVMGDAVNLASRLEGANKAFGTLMMAGERTYELAKDAIDFRELGGLRVKGKMRPVRVYEILGKKGETPGEKLDVARRFENALRTYERRDFAGAAEIFRALAAAGDPPAKVYLEECEKFAAAPPPPEWDGVIALAVK